MGLPEVVQTLLKLRWAWCCAHFPGEPVPVPDHALGEKPFPGIQTKSDRTQLPALFSSPVTGHNSEEICTSPSDSPQNDAEDHSDSLQSPFLQAEQTK